MLLGPKKMVNFCFLLHSLKMVGMPVSFWDGLFSGAILVSGSVRQKAFSVVFFSKVLGPIL